jgi:threonine/homoserine/homoserine lactone efflux protein
MNMIPDIPTFSLFLAAAFLLAVTPGPGIFYVLTRSLKGGRREGLASSLGTAIGGLGHVTAAALGLSAVLAASAVAFSVVKDAGAAYLIYLGIRTLRQTDQGPIAVEVAPESKWRAFYQGIVTEALNPKTALFFLAFIPQFINPTGPIVPQFALLGSLSVGLNTSADIVVVMLAGPLGDWLRTNARFRRGQQRFTGWALIGLGAYVALADNRR